MPRQHGTQLEIRSAKKKLEAEQNRCVRFVVGDYQRQKEETKPEPPWSTGSPITRAPSQYPKRRLSVRFRKVSMLQDLYLELADRSEIWRALRQHCCRCACQISKRYANLKYQSCGFETSRDLTIRCLFGYWDGALVITPQGFLTPSTVPSQTRGTLYKLSIPPSCTDLYKNNFVASSPVLWNGLDAGITEAQTIEAFRVQLAPLRLVKWMNRTHVFTLFLSLHLHFYLLPLFYSPFICCMPTLPFVTMRSAWLPCELFSQIQMEG